MPRAALQQRLGELQSPLAVFQKRWLAGDPASAPPPEGVFYNRMSASSHTRGHTYAPEYAAAVIEWLERHGRTVVNGRRALQLDELTLSAKSLQWPMQRPVPLTLAALLQARSIFLLIAGSAKILRYLALAGATLGWLA